MRFAPPTICATPAYLFGDFHSDKQKINEPTDKCVAHKIALLSEITQPQHNGASQIDMVFLLLVGSRTHPLALANCCSLICSQGCS